MNKLPESILNEATKGGSRNTSNASGDVTNATTSATASAASAITICSDTYIYGIVAVAVLAIGVCVLFAYSKKSA